VKEKTGFPMESGMTLWVWILLLVTPKSSNEGWMWAGGKAYLTLPETRGW
jgi:hypothetical protein